MGGVVSGNADFTGYMRTAGTAISLFGLVAMSFALWTTGDANLYLPAIQTASIFRRPKRVMEKLYPELLAREPTAAA